MKEIKDNEEKNSVPTSTSLKEKVEITQYVGQQSYQGLFKLNLKAIISTPYKETFLPDVSFSFFHPPKA